MNNQSLKVKCPLCEGRGDLQASEIVETFSNPELRKRLDARIEEIVELGSLPTMATNAKRVDFHKEVHSWNPALPIWRRSPKE